MTAEELHVKFQEDISWLGYCEKEREIIAHIKCAMDLLKEQEALIKKQRERIENLLMNLNTMLEECNEK